MTYLEVVSYTDASKWLLAMNEEIKSFHKNGTWPLVKPSLKKKIVSYKWVFKRKVSIPWVEDTRY